MLCKREVPITYNHFMISYDTLRNVLQIDCSPLGNPAYITSVLILLRWGHLSMSHHIIARRRRRGSSVTPRADRAHGTTFYCWEQRVLLHAISIMTSGRWASGIANLLTWFAYKDQHGYSNSLVLHCTVALQYEYARAPRVSDYYVLRHDIKTKFYGWQMAQTAEWR